MLRLANYYEKYIDEFIRKDELNKEEISVAKNGKLCFLALIGLLIKAKRELLDIKHLASLDTDERRIILTEKTKLNGTLISNYSKDDFDILLKQLVRRLIFYITPSYKNAFDNGEATSVSNYFKTDSKYYDSIIPYILNSFINNYVYKEECERYMELFD